VRVLLIAGLMLTSGAYAVAQSCNPVIDGTYCATQMPKRDIQSPPDPGKSPFQSLGGDLSLGSFPGDQPGMLGGFTFQGNTSCVGLLRRTNCN